MPLYRISHVSKWLFLLASRWAWFPACWIPQLRGQASVRSHTLHMSTAPPVCALRNAEATPQHEGLPFCATMCAVLPELCCSPHDGTVRRIACCAESLAPCFFLLCFFLSWIAGGRPIACVSLFGAVCGIMGRGGGQVGTYHILSGPTVLCLVRVLLCGGNIKQLVIWSCIFAVTDRLRR